jgi:hypothetical protein
VYTEKLSVGDGVDVKPLNNNAVLKKLLNANKPHDQFSASAASGSTEVCWPLEFLHIFYYCKNVQITVHKFMSL